MIFPICTPRLKVRLPTIGDLSDYLTYRNDPSDLVDQKMSALDDKSAASFLHAQSNFDAGAFGWRMFGLERRDRSGLIGEVGVFIGSEKPLEGDIGWWLSAAHRKQGYATEAVCALIDWCFTERGLHRLTAQCLASNTASQDVMRRVGMRFEMKTKESRHLAGNWYEEIGYAILKREWTHRP